MIMELNAVLKLSTSIIFLINDVGINKEHKYMASKILITSAVKLISEQFFQRGSITYTLSVTEVLVKYTEKFFYDVAGIF